VSLGTLQENPLKRSPTLKPFVLDILLSEGRKLIEGCLVDYEKKSTAHSNTLDKELCKPYEDALDRAQKAAEEGIGLLREELNRIEQHVDNLRAKRWPEVTADSQKHSGSSSGRNRAPPQNDPFAKLALQFSAEPKDLRLFSQEEAQLVKASYAYKKNFRSGHPDHFAFSMASRSLCEIKARSHSQGFTSVTQTFGSCMSVPTSSVRVFSAAPRSL
jgi:RNA-dependent RNA polymerase